MVLLIRIRRLTYRYRGIIFAGLALLALLVFLTARLWIPAEVDYHDWRLSYKADSSFVDSIQPLQYCNEPDYIKLGDEGVLDADRWRLESVAILIRHGDRLPLRPVKNADKLTCRFPAFDSPAKTQLDRFFDAVGSPRFPRNPVHSAHPNRENRCQLGDLTFTGVRQHFKLGSVLGERFRHLIEDDLKRLSVITSNVSRTFQSSLAFLWGFLGEEKFRQWPNDIFVSESDMFCGSWNECKLRCLGERDVEANVMRIAHTQLENHPEMKQLLYDLVNILWQDPSGVNLNHHMIPSLSLLDAMMGFACQRLPFPCDSQEAEKRCGSWQHLRQVVSFLNWQTRVIYADASFKRMSLLRSYGIFRTVQKFFTARKSDVLLISGHDVNIVPVANALGVDEMGGWPPYASRIVFELYTAKEMGPQQRAKRDVISGRNRREVVDAGNKYQKNVIRRVFDNDGTNPGGRKLFVAPRMQGNPDAWGHDLEEDREPQQPPLPRQGAPPLDDEGAVGGGGGNGIADDDFDYSAGFVTRGVRIIYNGRDVTRKIRFCRGEYPCPWLEFSRFVSDLKMLWRSPECTR